MQRTFIKSLILKLRSISHRSNRTKLQTKVSASFPEAVVTLFLWSESQTITFGRSAQLCLQWGFWPCNSWPSSAAIVSSQATWLKTWPTHTILRHYLHCQMFLFPAHLLWHKIIWFISGIDVQYALDVLQFSCQRKPCFHRNRSRSIREANKSLQKQGEFTINKQQHESRSHVRGKCIYFKCY